MLKVDKYAKIRLAHRDGMSIREIARVFHHSRRKVREVLAQPLPVPYTRSKAPPAPVLGSFHPTIDGILAADEEAPPKQRHTAMQLFRRLRDEYGYRGGYDQVRRYVGSHRRNRRETFIPLAHDPGQRLEADGQASGEPLVIVDALGASRGGVVLVSTDGDIQRKLRGNTCPARLTVVGLVDFVGGRAV